MLALLVFDIVLHFLHFPRDPRPYSSVVAIVLLAVLLFFHEDFYALGDPRTAVNLVQARNVVVLVDASASMQATDVAPSRLDAAKDQVKAIVRGLSGSDRMLKAMHRVYTADRYFSLTEKLRAARPDIALTTDIIVGFPGETDADYAATRDLVERVGFDNAFVFRYSPRRDTPAADMGEQLAEPVKEERNQDLLRVVDTLARQKSDALVGRNVEILCEGPSKTNKEKLTGRTPGNKIVIFEGGERHIGEVFEVAVTRSSGFSLYGDPAVLDGSGAVLAS